LGGFFSPKKTPHLNGFRNAALMARKGDISIASEMSPFRASKTTPRTSHT
jgi:hypothetical protein